MKAVNEPGVRTQALTQGKARETVRKPRAESAPVKTWALVHLFGEPVTVNDAKARRELGYAGKTTREEGLARLKSLL